VSQRLSSGQRINSASDDAAGLAISSALDVKARVYQQASRNLNDAISMVSIATGSLASLTDIATRIAELAEQAANGTFSSQQRAALDGEPQALTAEYNRVIETTTFNGLKLLDGQTNLFRIQAG
jgi:flagellin